MSAASTLKVAVSVEVTLDVILMTMAIARRDWVSFPGAVLRLLIMGGLGTLAVWWQRRWAQRIFAGLLYLGAVGGLFAAFFEIPGGRFRFEPVGLGMFVIYGLLGITASIEEDCPSSSEGSVINRQAD